MSFPIPWGAYIAGHPNNTTTQLYDFTGNGRNATIGGTAPSFSQGSGNGATASIPYIIGTSTTTITWPAGSIPATFTILSATRYTSAPYARILQATTIDFVLGHINYTSPFTNLAVAKVGVEYHAQWMTQNGANSPNVSSSTDWLVMCGTTGGATPNNILVNGVGNGTSTGGTGNSTLTINNGLGTTQTSNFAFQQVLIWDTSLTAAQMKSISDLVLNYLSTGTIAYPWPGGLGQTYPCFKQGTRILAFIKGREQYVPVETLVKGDLIKTLRSGYKPVSIIGQKTIQNSPDSNIKNRLFRYSQHVCPELFEDLFITGEHCVLVNGLPDKKLQEIREYMGDIFTTEGEYRLPAHLDERAGEHGLQGQAVVWHFALEHEDPCANYGVYANGLLVESASEEYLQDYSDIELK